MEADAAQFSAFVSYSHADAAIAKKLHRRIETYKLPKLLRAIGPGGKDDGRLGQIFRDREDLPAALDLSESVKAALAQSRALIVLCSPHAKDSPWVAKEIELFRELHPDRPILAALIDGEPEEAFPPALLLGGEPLAADLRKSGDGWRLGLLKLVAGVAEVPLDALVQRDSQRHIRSVMTVTLVVGVALLAMIGMTAFAIQQRNAAQHQQVQAEGLVEFMLTDLRTALKGVGRLDVMTDVNERAMDYYEAQDDLSDMPAESLERRARILHAMGEDDEKRGDLDKALAKFTEAHRVTEALLARDPDNADRIFGHAQSQYWVGRIDELRERWEPAMDAYAKYRESAIKLYGQEPISKRALLERGFAENNIGIIEFRRGADQRKVRRSFDNAVRWFQEATVVDPNDDALVAELANAVAWRADTYFREGRYRESKADRLFEERLKQKILDANPKNVDAIFKLAITKRALALNDEKLANVNEALSRLNDAGRDMRVLVKSDPKNRDWATMARLISKDTKRITNTRGEGK